MKIFSGEKAFELRATHGLPLADIFILCEKEGFIIDWIGFILHARTQKRFDFQTFEDIESALKDSGAWIDFHQIILDRIKSYMIWNEQDLN